MRSQAGAWVRRGFACVFAPRQASPHKGLAIHARPFYSTRSLYSQEPHKTPQLDSVIRFPYSFSVDFHGLLPVRQHFLYPKACGVDGVFALARGKKLLQALAQRKSTHQSVKKLRL